MAASNGILIKVHFGTYDTCILSNFLVIFLRIRQETIGQPYAHDRISYYQGTLHIALCLELLLMVDAYGSTSWEAMACGVISHIISKFLLMRASLSEMRQNVSRYSRHVPG